MVLLFCVARKLPFSGTHFHFLMAVAKKEKALFGFVLCTVDFFHNFGCRFETSCVHFKSRESDILHETIDDLTSKLINYGKESKENDQF